ncbi:MAG: 1-acyl-sn-glycerol-3-phosphate acyltransferase, partial [Deltaproteobacteria bacterium]|nr:1-acyl-sn-glycerol-3-phosphate acyltransferase [Deltaproteobacteria bacterium]
MRKKNERYNKTLFNSCLAMPLYLLSLAILKIIGWKIDNDISRHYRKAVIVGAPHTTNWDFFFAMLFFFGMRMRHLYVLGKESLIKPPLGFIMLWLGVLPVNRSIAKNSVAKAIEILNRAENMFIALTPEGTRKDVAEW